MDGDPSILITAAKISNNATETGIKVSSLAHDWCEME